MFGLEGEQKMFEFDLEKDLKEDHNKKKNVIDMLESEMMTLKNDMRECDPKSEDFNQMGILIHGYEAAKKVLSQI